MSQSVRAFVVMLCVIGACGIALFSAAARPPWHPPGEDQETDFECKPWSGTEWRCEAFHVRRVPFPGKFPIWEAYPSEGKRCDIARGIVAFLEPFKGQSHLIIMKPGIDPHDWKQKRYDPYGRILTGENE